MVTKADLMEPQDKFHRAGAGTKRGGGGEEDAPFTPNLESIREDSCESRPSSEDEHSRYVAGSGRVPGWEEHRRQGRVPGWEGRLPGWEGWVPGWEGWVPGWEGWVPGWEGWVPG